MSSSSSKVKNMSCGLTLTKYLQWVQVLGSSVRSEMPSLCQHRQRKFGCLFRWLVVHRSKPWSKSVLPPARPANFACVSLPTDVPASVQRDPTSGARPGLVTSAGCREDEEGERRKI